MSARSPEGPSCRAVTCWRIRAARRLSGSTARTSSAVTRAGSRSPAASDVSAAVSRRSSRRSSLVCAEDAGGGHRRQASVAHDT